MNTTKIALVTGAWSGIGEATARQLAEQGYTVYGAARRVERMAHLADDGIRVLAIAAGLADSAASEQPSAAWDAMANSLLLNNGVELPALGFGVFQTPPAETIDAVTEALRVGYRHIDTAAAYGNEREVGEAIARSDVDRDDVFIETKVWPTDYGFESTLHAFDKSTGKLGVDTIDLFILHQALPGDFDRTLGAYRALEQLLADGRVRAIGNQQLPSVRPHLTAPAGRPLVSRREPGGGPPVLPPERRDRGRDAEHGIPSPRRGSPTERHHLLPGQPGQHPRRPDDRRHRVGPRQDV